MKTSRILLLFGLLILVSGCAQRCAYPDGISDAPASQCFYHLVVTDVDTNNYTVTAEIPRELNYTDRPPDKFKFRVREFDQAKNLLKPGSAYYFIREGNSPTLDFFYAKPTGIDQGSYKSGK